METLKMYYSELKSLSVQKAKGLNQYRVVVNGKDCYYSDGKLWSYYKGPSKEEMDEISKKYDNENPTDEEIKKMSDEIDSKSKRYDIEVYIGNKSLVEYIEKYL